MMCPKCGIGRLSGPRYSEISGPIMNTERLIRICSECGWEKSEPCADAKQENHGL
jgi:hypothetical protein